MTDEAQDTFFEVLDIPEPEREAWIDSRCANATLLAAEVRALLAADRAADGFLDPPSPEPAAYDAGRWLEGRTIGGYAIVRRVGIGGMGTVYEAVQSRPRRNVALKLLRVGLVAPEARRRFEQESEILGRLRHRAIAEIYEAGTYESEFGPIPFFVLEFIEHARTISAWVDEGRLEARAVIGLVIEICEAVQHAHEQHVIHRDIKPSNILIGLDGRPRLIDFGVARATDHDSRRVTLATAVGELVGTLHYMSPEQCAFDGRNVDARTDVYSLGVVLYELLAGRLPYPVERVAPAMVPELVRSHVPTPPLRGTTRRWPDLDAVVLTALEKRPCDRYATATAFADDLRRALRGEPVQAVRSQRLYRLRRWWWAGRKLVPLAVMTTGVGVGLWSWLRVDDPGVAPATAVADPPPTAERDRYRHRIAVAERARDADDPSAAKLALGECPAEHRHWEWWRLQAQLDQSLHQLQLDAPVDALAYDAAGRRLVAVTEAGTLAMFEGVGSDPTTPPRVGWQVATADAYLTLAIDPEHARVYVAGDKKRVTAYDLADGATIEEFAPGNSSIWGLAIVEHPHGLLITRESGVLERWDLPEPHLRYAQSVGKRLGRVTTEGADYLGVLDDDRVVLGDVATGLAVRSFAVGERPEAVVLFADQIVAAGWERRMVAIDRVGDPEPEATDTLTMPILDLERLDETTLVIAGSDGAIRLWDRTRRVVTSTLRGHDFGVRALAVGPGGLWFASGGVDASVRLWDRHTAALDTVLVGAPEKIHALAWAAAGDVLITGGGVEWDRSNANELIAWTTRDGVAVARAGDHGATIETVVAMASIVVSGDRDGTLVIRRASDLAVRHRIAAHGQPLRALALRHDGHVVASASDDGTIALWETDGGRAMARIDATVGGLQALAWHGDVIIAVGERGVARWSPSGTTITATATARRGLRAVAVDAAGHTFVGDDRGVLAKLDADGTEIWATDTLGRRIHGLAIDPTGSRLAVAGDDGRVRLLDADDGAVLSTIGSHEAPAIAVAFSPDGTSLASGGFDLRARIWRAPGVVQGARHP